eukprot:1156961-Pelagomonas_calceolata.AAC.10
MRSCKAVRVPNGEIQLQSAVIGGLRPQRCACLPEEIKQLVVVGVQMVPMPVQHIMLDIQVVPRDVTCKYACTGSPHVQWNA